MRLLVDATGVRDGSGGVETHLHCLTRAWHQTFHEDRLTIMASGHNAYHLAESLSGWDVVRVDRADPIARLAELELLVPRLARRHDGILALDPRLPVFRSPSVPAIIFVHDLRHLDRPDEFSRLRRTFRTFSWGRSLARASGVLVPSQATAASVERHYGRQYRDVTIVPHGADHVDRWERGMPATGGGVAYAHWSNKRPELAIAAWAALRKYDGHFEFPLDIVGARPEGAPHLHALARGLGVSDLVRIHPRLPDAEYQRLVSSARVVVITSTLEGFCLPIIEALRLGVPVVIVKDAAMEETAAGRAIVAASSSPESLASAIRDALERPDRPFEVKETWTATAEATRAAVLRTISLSQGVP